MRQVDINRFWENVEKGEGCWIWHGSNNGRYGQLSVKMASGSWTTYLAHRISYELEFGEVPLNMQVLHRCNNTLCVNPEHLCAGTQCDNLKQMFEEGREPDLKGEYNGQAKLNSTEIRKIRASTDAGISLAKRFHVSPATISMIRRGHRWSHVR